MTFIPSYRSTPLQNIYATQDRLIRNIKLHDYFFNDDDNNNYNHRFRNRSFTLPSSWIPPDRKISDTTLRTVDNIVTSTENFLKRYRIVNNRNVFLRNFRDNLTSAERKAISELRRNQNIIIKPADKGSATVVINKSAYINEIYRQLHNPSYYRKLDQPIYSANIDNINSILQEMHDDGYITDKELLFLRARPSDNQRKFYVLPKIHKPRDKWPQPGKMPEGRPIVADTNSESYRVSKFIDYFLRPLSILHPSYIKDTYDFIDRISLRHIPKGSFLVTGDVTSLYTNMDIQRTLNIVRNTLISHPAVNRPDDYLLRLLDITLKNNDFEFNGEYFLQTKGIAMGKSFAPSLADLYLTEFDYICSNGYMVKPQLFHRFLDDIFFIWSGTVQQLMEYQDFINSIIPDIKVSLSWSSDNIDFLDTTVYKHYGSDYDTILTKVHFKPTDTHQLLHRGSFHPRHTTTGILKSQLLRFRRISSCRADYNDACRILFSSLRLRGYSTRYMRKMKTYVWNLSTTIKSNNTTDKDVLPIVIPFNDVGTGLIRLWRNILNNNSIFCNTRFINAYTVGRNLSKLLVSNQINRTTTTSIRPTNILPNGCFCCHGPRCKVCNRLVTGSTFVSSYNGRSYTVRGHITCKSTNLVYLITCRRCNLQYVGQTSRSLADRTNDHLSYIRNSKLNTPTGLHFNQPGHQLSDFSIMGIDHLISLTSTNLPIFERKWQQLLQTHFPMGINQANSALLSS